MDSAERAARLIAAVRDDEVLDLAAGVVARPSFQQDEAAVGRYVAEQMERLGYQVEIQEVANGRFNVIGVLPGTGDGPNMLLNCHLDHPMSVGWTHDPYTAVVEGDKVYGAGIQDMKGGLASMIAGAAALGRIDRFPRGDVVVAVVMHHDTVGLGAKFFLASTDRRFAYGINGEPSALRIHVAHGSAIQIEATALGTEAHTSAREYGNSAISQLVKFLGALDESCLTYTPFEDLPDLPRLVVGWVQGGGPVSIVPHRASARFDVRGVPGMTPETVRADARRLADRLGVQMRFNTHAYQKPLLGNPRSPVVTALLAAHERVLGKPTVVSNSLPTQAFISDASDMQREGVETAIYGPCEWRMVPDEWASVSELQAAARVYALAAADLSSSSPGA
jgi:succinyl-diaminopimelate desuccinylase